jgi:hypothetical protein
MQGHLAMSRFSHYLFLFLSLIPNYRFILIPMWHLTPIATGLPDSLPTRIITHRLTDGNITMTHACYAD